MEAKKIVLIEDNTPIKKLFKTVLSKEGFEVHDFSNAKDALEWLKGNEPDLIISDILLPDISGTELLDEIKKVVDLNTHKAIAVTGFASEADKKMYLKEGFIDYITKPVNTKEFVKKVKELVN